MGIKVTSGGLGLLGSLGSSAASLLMNRQNINMQRETNANNLKIAQMSNEFNERMMNKQMAYNTMMWERQNEYNSAANQRKRLEEAGLNPYLMMNGGNAGTASNAGGISPAQAVTPSMQAPQNDVSAISSTLGSLSQMLYNLDKQNAESANMNALASTNETEAMYRGAKLLSDISESKSRTKSNLAKTSYQLMENSIFQQQWELSKSLQQRTIEGMQLDNKQKALQNGMSAVQLEWLPIEKRMNVIMQSVDIDYKRKQGILTDYQARHELSRILETEARTEGLKIDNYIKDQSKQFLIDLNKYNSVNAYNNRGADGLFGIPNLLTNKTGDSSLTGMGIGLGRDIGDFFKSFYNDAKNTWVKKFNKPFQYLDEKLFGRKRK